MTRGAARAPAEIVLADAAAITDWEAPLLRALSAVDPRLALVLLAGTFTKPPVVPWAKVLRKPIDVSGIVRALDKVYAARPGERPATESQAAIFALRHGAPWPAIACTTCNVSRQLQSPTSAPQAAAVRADMLGFLLEHVACLKR